MGTNRYAYSFNDPVNLSDRNGHAAQQLKTGGGGGVKSRGRFGRWIRKQVRIGTERRRLSRLTGGSTRYNYRDNTYTSAGITFLGGQDTAGCIVFCSGGGRESISQELGPEWFTLMNQLNCQRGGACPMMGNMLGSGGGRIGAGSRINLPAINIPRINGRVPINSQYANRTHPRTGVFYNERGFPDFSSYSRATVNVRGLNGRYRHDEAIANRAAGFRSTPRGMIWHHHENGVTMQLVPSGIHRATPHTGGAAIIRNGGFD